MRNRNFVVADNFLPQQLNRPLDSGYRQISIIAEDFGEAFFILLEDVIEVDLKLIRSIEDQISRIIYITRNLRKRSKVGKLIGVGIEESE